MKRVIFAGALALLAVTPANASTTISFPGGATPPPSDVTVFEDFETKAAGDSLGTNAAVYAASAGTAARPAFLSTGNFGAVLGGGTADFTFARPAKRFGFALGSLDTYNSLTLRYADSTTQTFTGLGITGGSGAAGGNQTIAASNGFVTFRRAAGDARITGASFTSGANSFEFDGLSVGGVPEPTTWALMILGFGMIGGASRRISRRRATA